MSIATAHASSGLLNAYTSLDGADRGDPLASSFATSYAGVIAFIAVVHEGSFACAARRLGIGRSAVSRNVQRLETQLDTRLFLRTTRSTSLTDEGRLFYESCRPGVEGIVRSIEEMRELRHSSPRGQLRINAPVGFGRNVVAPLLHGFRRQYPDITLDLMLDDRPVDFVADRIDISFRNGRMDDSQVIARQLLPMALHICAAPDYLRTHGQPRTINDLSTHQCINFRTASGRMQEWEFKLDGIVHRVAPRASQCFNDADLVLQAVLRGEGVAQIAGWQAAAHLHSGALRQCMEDYAPAPGGHYLCYLSRHHLPVRIRAFIDYMTQQLRALNFHIYPKETNK